MFLNSKAYVHFNIRILYMILLSLAVMSVHSLNITKYAETITSLTEPGKNLTNPSFFFPDPETRRHCVQMQCKFVCFNGKSASLPDDFYRAMNDSSLYCERITELRLYNYEFPNAIIQRNFLGEYSRRVEMLYVASSHVVDFEAGAFSNGIYEELNFENLELTELRKDFFEGISSSFRALTVIQENSPIARITSDCTDHVRSQIKYLSLQVGLTAVQNITAGSTLLSNLAYVDFSYNNFGHTINENAFQRLSVVEHLDLSYSNIQSLPEYIFTDLTGTLEYVNLSFNKLVTIHQIFGWREISRDLKVYASGNPWQCTCALQAEMKKIFAYYTAVLICESPEAFHSWSVFDERICVLEEENAAEIPDGPYTTETTVVEPIAPTITFGTTSTTPAKTSEATTSESTTMALTDTTVYTTSSQTVHDVFTTTSATTPGTTESNFQTDIVSLECQSPSSRLDNNNWQKLKWPSLIFQVKPLTSLSVAIRIESEQLDDSYGLMWFSKVTTQYYKMETNYNEYGLGCYGSIAYTTTVHDLVPDMAYTFCLILKNERTTSPFSCKSVHVHSNLQVSYGAWLTHDMRATGISVAVLAIVMFTFLGISVVFLILKRKPTLIKGSKRVALTKGGKDEIVVFPREHTKHTIQQREQILANRNSRRQLNRYDSMESIDSNQSYMNANLYEVIPAYLKLNDEQLMPSSQSMFPPPTQFDDEQAESYLPPLRTESSTAHLVSYAEIPYRSKRISNDPLPEVPTNASATMGTDETAQADKDDDDEDKVSVYYASMYDSRV